MIGIRKQAGEYVPVVICDQCGEMITDALSAVQVSSPAPEGTTAQAFHVHKGACDEGLTERLGGIDGSEELAVHLMRLIQGTLGGSDRGQVEALLKWMDEEPT